MNIRIGDDIKVQQKDEIGVSITSNIAEQRKMVQKSHGSEIGIEEENDIVMQETSFGNESVNMNSSTSDN